MQGLTIRIAGRLATGLLLLAVMLHAATLPAQNSSGERAAIEIISIEHRDPLFVRAQLMPLLDPRGDIGLVDNKLIIASSASNLQQLKTLIAEADVPARRLVVSVDFDYGNRREGNAAQQSSQALEGDVVSFIDGPAVVDAPANVLPDNLASAIVAPDSVASQSTPMPPQITISSMVRGSSVQADVEIANVPGFSGSHPLTLTLGEWYVLNPVVAVSDELPLQSDVDSIADVAAAPVDAPAVTPAPVTAPLVSPVAVRVDVLP